MSEPCASTRASPPPRRRQAAGAGLFGLMLSLLSTPRTASAEPPSAPRVLRLEYHGAVEGCPAGEQAFRDAVAAQLGREPFEPTASDRLFVTLARRGHGYEGSVVERDPSGRVLWSRSFAPTARCLDAIEDLAISVRIRLAPRPGAEAPPPARRQRIFGHPGDATPDAAPTAPSKREEALLFRAGAGASLDLGTAPRPAVGLSLELGLRWSWFSIAAELHGTPPAGAEVGDGAEVSSSRITGALVPCGHLGWLAGCAVVALGQLRGASSPANTPDAASALFFAAGGRLGIEIPVASHLAVRLAAELLGTRSTVYRLDGKPVWQAAPLTGGPLAGLVASF